MELTDLNKSWQKLCSSEDYFHPDFDRVVREVLGNLPSFHRKQWEFAVIYLNLLKEEKLNPSSLGASFGAGREPLIYLITQKIKHFHATDLYVYNTGWQTAKIDEGMTCKEFVLELAPKFFDSSKLSVSEMDMREIDFDSDSLDFCYSSCAFEHIGHKEDFIQHLKEVKRVLKPNGVYVMTSEHLFLNETIKVKGNYKFDLQFLLEIFKEANFYPDDTFTTEMVQSHINKARPEFDVLDGVSTEMMNHLPGMILSKRGIPYTSSCFVFRKSNTSFDIYEKNKKSIEIGNFIKKQMDRTVQSTFQSRKILDPFYNLKSDTKSKMYDHMEYLTSNHEIYFKDSPIQDGHFVFTEFIYLNDHNFNFTVQLAVSDKTKIKVKLLENNPIIPSDRELLELKNINVDGVINVDFTHKARNDRAYAIAIFHKNKQNIKLERVSVSVKLLM